MKKTIAIILVLVLILSLLTACVGGSSSGSHKTATCKSCGRTYEAGDSGGNFMNIARTGMCKRCYNNFQWGQAATGK